MKRLTTSVFALLVSSALLFAHGDATHIIGTVAAIDGNHVTVKTQDGKSEMVMLEKTTKYMKGEKLVKSTDLKIGAPVTINAKMDLKTKKYVAEDVMLGAKDDKTKAAPAKK